jgi:hypothetical protein
VHQVPAFFYDRVCERLQSGVDNRLRGADLGVDCGAAATYFASCAAVICDVKLHLAGHFLQCLQYISVLHVVNGDVEGMFCPLDELN